MHVARDRTVVDLAKTPGRRKDVPKTTRAAAVAMAASQKKIKALNLSMEVCSTPHLTLSPFELGLTSNM